MPVMKSLTTLILFFITLAVNAEDLKLPHVSVYGTAETKAVPDEMIWSLSIQSKGNEVAQVAAVHDKKVAKVLAFIKEQKIEDKEVKTSRIRLSENWVNRGRERVKEGYVASTGITFKSKHLDQYQKIWMGVAQLPDVSVGGISFDSSQRIKIQNETRLKALTMAKEKAAAMAKALGASIHEPLVIAETGPTVYQGGMRNSVMAMQQAGAAGTSIAPGTISVTSRVQVKFRISSK